MACKKYELGGVKSGSYSGPARSYAINRLTSHYRSADKPFYAMEVAQPYHLARISNPYEKSAVVPARSYAKSVPYQETKPAYISLGQAPIKTYREQPITQTYSQPSGIQYAQPLEGKLSNVYRENPTLRPQTITPSLIETTPRTRYKFTELKPQYASNTLQHRYGVFPVEQKKTYEKLEEKVLSKTHQPDRIYKPLVFDVKKKWDAEKQKQISVVNIMQYEDLERMLEGYSSQDSIYVEANGRAKEEKESGINNAVYKSMLGLIQAYSAMFKMMMDYMQVINKLNAEKFEKNCPNCKQPTDGRICDICGMIQK